MLVAVCFPESLDGKVVVGGWGGAVLEELNNLRK